MARQLAPLHHAIAPSPGGDVGRGATRDPLGAYLIGIGSITPETLMWARKQARTSPVGVGEILVSHGYIGDTDLAKAYAAIHRCSVADLEASPADSRLLKELGIERALAMDVLPLRRVGRAILVAICDPAAQRRHDKTLRDMFGEVFYTFITRAQMVAATIHLLPQDSARRAETRLNEHDSCRRLRHMPTGAVVCGILVALSFYQFPRWSVTVATLVALSFMLIWATLKVASCVALLMAKRRRRSAPSLELPPPRFARDPVVTVLVPLYRETSILPHLIERLRKLTYPSDLLDVILILEEDDRQVAAYLANAPLPSWMRTLTVPAGSIKTKPRAMNLALDIARGSIIGIYDAEDAPDPDQISHVVRKFASLPPEVMCLQGQLDYYRSSNNWLSRCFALEYAGWFGIILPGLQTFQFPIPLGGTTVFFRRRALEDVGGWDAHNVTEDADLGIRLVRRGYRTEVIDTVTWEEPNCRAWPWIKQRSRWYKGYALTYLLHMRNPVQLWRDLGTRAFLGMQFLFLSTLLGFLLAPFLWYMVLLPFGFTHPIPEMFGAHWGTVLTVFFLSTEVFMILVTVYAAYLRGDTALAVWAPTMTFYFPLATIAAYKAVAECVYKPFFWDKTEHGIIKMPLLKTRARKSRWWRR